MAKLVKTIDNETTLVYEGVGANVGVTYTIAKDNTMLDVRVQVPHPITAETWQDFKAKLDILL